MHAFTVRRAGVADIDVLLRHRIHMFQEMGRWSPDVDVAAFESEYREWLLKQLPSEGYVSWLVEGETTDNGVRAVLAGGGATIIPWPPGPFYRGSQLAFVYNVYTEPAHRGQGLARRIMDTIHDFCRSRGIESVALNASEFGQPLYESMGYRVTPSPMMFLSLG
jgi:GNAT superfamily N-acetyltransferase